VGSYEPLGLQVFRYQGDTIKLRLFLEKSSPNEGMIHIFLYHQSNIPQALVLPKCITE
jgi:hypothetical protein